MTLRDLIVAVLASSGERYDESAILDNADEIRELAEELTDDYYAVRSEDIYCKTAELSLDTLSYGASAIFSVKQRGHSVPFRYLRGGRIALPYDGVTTVQYRYCLGVPQDLDGECSVPKENFPSLVSSIVERYVERHRPDSNDGNGYD